MPQFFAKITDDYWTEKNRLHAEILCVARAFDCVLMQDEEELQEYLNQFQNHITLANNHHPRCKPRNLEITRMPEHQGKRPRSIYVPGIFSLKIWEVAKSSNSSEQHK